MAACKSCERSIIWAEGPNGKMMPFDEPPRGLGAKPPDGDWVVINGKARRATEEDRRLHRERLTCHFATCDSPELHRRPR
jgi:hypothetical protein